MLTNRENPPGTALENRPRWFRFAPRVRRIRQVVAALLLGPLACSIGVSSENEGCASTNEQPDFIVNFHNMWQSCAKDQSEFLGRLLQTMREVEKFVAPYQGCSRGEVIAVKRRLSSEVFVLIEAMIGDRYKGFGYSDCWHYLSLASGYPRYGLEPKPLDYVETFIGCSTAWHSGNSGKVPSPLDVLTGTCPIAALPETKSVSSE